MRGLILGILLFFVLVLIHEFGHFIAAKKSGVKVLEFGFGIPPRLFTIYTDKSGTKYTFNLFPLGGFVRMKGEDPKDPDEFKAIDSFITAKLWKKIIILVAGVGMNLLWARVLFTTVFVLGTEPITILPDNAIAGTSESLLMPTFDYLEELGFIEGETIKVPARILQVEPDELWEQIGLQSGDIIIRVNKTDVNARNLGSILKKSIWDSLVIEYQRDEEILTHQTECPDDSCLLGVVIASSGNLQLELIKFPLGGAMLMWLKEIKEQTKLTLGALGKLGKSLFSFNRKEISKSLNKLTGPVWAIKFGEKLLKHGGWILYLWFAGMISLALAIFNILPIPALDWWRLVGVLIQWIGKLKPEKYFTIENYINLIFFILLIILGIYILLKDLVRFWDIPIPFIG